MAHSGQTRNTEIENRLVIEFTEAEYMRLTGAVLAKRHGVAAKHALYRANGLWYHLLKEFPGVLFDAAGYIVFSTAEEYESCNAIKRYEQKNHARVKDGIAQIPGYTPFSGAV